MIRTIEARKLKLIECILKLEDEFVLIEMERLIKESEARQKQQNLLRILRASLPTKKQTK